MATSGKREIKKTRRVDSAGRPLKGPLPKYADKPQRAITLKSDIGQTDIPTETVTRQQVTARKSPNTPKPKTTQSPRHWTLRGVSDEARNIATQKAEEQGLKVSEWLEQLILEENHLPKEMEVSGDQLQEALEDIRIRLERIEQQRGYFSRLWERLITGQPPI